MPSLLALAGNWRAWAGLAVAGLMLAVYVQTLRLSATQADLRAAEASMAVLGTQISRQNDHVRALEAESAARLSRAAEAARLAKERASTLSSQIERLRASRKPQAVVAAEASSCPAGLAVQEVRRALSSR